MALRPLWRALHGTAAAVLPRLYYLDNILILEVFFQDEIGNHFWQLMCPGLDIVPHPITGTFPGGQFSMYLEMMKRK
uniref:uncharacterized protein LOC118554694 isoform X2 n=1 Tax=Halichoerus grypus TaxID=9711 RepID=UPI0016591670|nr:uncharacterized protein LOC118554694 isoform X2 [Halichoerus grypus]